MSIAIPLRRHASERKPHALLMQVDSLIECTTTRIVNKPACSPDAYALYFSCGFCGHACKGNQARQ